MTDKELATQAEYHLRRTTISYPEWVKRKNAGRYVPPDASGTEWGKAFVALEQIGTVVEPPPDPDPPPVGTWPPAGAYPELTLDFETAPGSVWHEETHPPATYIVRQAPDPRGGTNKVLKSHTEPNGPGPNAQSSNADFYVNNGQAYATQGKHTWYRGDLLLVEGQWVPTRGGWNWLMNWHISGSVSTSAGAASCTLGVRTDSTQSDANPRFFLQYQGGVSSSPQKVSLDLVPVTYGLHSFVFEYLWSTRTDGFCNVFHNGTLVRKFTGPNLYTRTDGQPDLLAWGLYNYHLKASVPITTYWDRTAVGPTQGSVGL